MLNTFSGFISELWVGVVTCRRLGLPGGSSSSLLSTWGCHLWIVSGSPKAIEVGRIYHAFPLKNENRYFTMFFNGVVIF